MATVSRSQDNIFPIPMNCTVNKKTGYVLANLTNEYASSNSKGKCSYSTHKKIGIGYAVDQTNWKDNRFMYANKKDLHKYADLSIYCHSQVSLSSKQSTKLSNSQL